MKKTFSKIIAIALTAMITACMTSCEDERDVPTYGTVIESTQAVIGPKSAAELEDYHLDNEILCLHLIIGNANGSMTPSELVTVKVTGGDGANYFRPAYNGEHYDAAGITTNIIDYGYKYHIPYGFITAYTESNSALVTVTDNYSGEIIGEWEVDVAGINDAPWIH